jgi:hypothetical protein
MHCAVRNRVPPARDPSQNFDPAMLSRWRGHFSIATPSSVAKHWSNRERLMFLTKFVDCVIIMLGAD